METLANGFRASRLGHGRPSNCHFVNINSRKGCRSPSKGHSCTKSATRLTRRTLVAAVASVNAVAEEEETRASNGGKDVESAEEGPGLCRPKFDAKAVRVLVAHVCSTGLQTPCCVAIHCDP